jgi:hypothetical protein
VSAEVQNTGVTRGPFHDAPGVTLWLVLGILGLGVVMLVPVLRGWAVVTFSHDASSLYRDGSVALVGALS